jgi:SAM-dependent methyltransferase
MTDPRRPPQRASPWVERFVSLIPPGQVLDVACGNGRHTRLLLERGYDVVAVDRDLAPIADPSQRIAAVHEAHRSDGPPSGG